MPRLRLLSVLCALPLLAACGWLGLEEEGEARLEGERIAIVSDLGALVPSDSLDSVSVELPEPSVPRDWPQSGGNARHQTAHVKLSGALDKTSSASAGEGNGWEFGLIAAPVLCEGTLFSMDAQGVIAAATQSDPATTLWSKTLGEEDADYIGGGLACSGRTVFSTLATGMITALDAKTGAKRWNRALKTPVRSAPALAEDKVLVVTVDSQLFALDAASGEILWRHRGIQETSALLGAVVPAAQDGRVVVAYPSGEIYALELEDGKVLWTDSLILPRRTTALGAFTGVGGDPVIADGVVYTVSRNGLLAANDLATGTRIWEQPVSANASPWIAGDFLYVVTTSRHVACLYRPDGRVKWVKELPETDDSESLTGPYLINGRLVVPASEAGAYLYDPVDGAYKGTAEHFPSGRLSAAAFAGGMLYLVERDAALHVVW
jgi:outer membrane protein assembly factor BamB